MMINPDSAYAIKITGASGINVSDGDEVSIQVIKHLVGNKWAIGFMGRVYPAKTNLELYPEQIIKVRVIKTGNQIQFKLIESKTKSLSSLQPGLPDTQQNFITSLLKKNGLPDDLLARQLITALMNSEMPIDPGFIQKIREKLVKEKKTEDTIIRLLVNLLGKKIDISSILSSTLSEEFLPVLDYGSQQQDKDAQHRKKRDLSFKHITSKQIKEQFINIIKGKEGIQDNLLQVFNHLQGREDSWVIIPFQFLNVELLFTGNLKLLLNNINHEIKKAVLVVNLVNGDKWSFFINPGKNQINILVFSNKKVYIDKKSKSFNALMHNLQNLGVKIDDKIYDDKYFDGFYPLFSVEGYKIEGYKAINTIL